MTRILPASISHLPTELPLALWGKALNQSIRTNHTPYPFQRHPPFSCTPARCVPPILELLHASATRSQDFPTNAFTAATIPRHLTTFRPFSYRSLLIKPPWSHSESSDVRLGCAFTLTAQRFRRAILSSRLRLNLTSSIGPLHRPIR